jgi:hypothetical protein
MTRLLDAEVPAAWSAIRAVRHDVGEVLTGHPAELRTATMMTASELLENAVKYGEKMGAAPCISFSLVAADGQLVVEVINRSTSDNDVRGLEECIDRISRAPDKETIEKLYLARLEEVMARNSEGGRLGLYRVALEGGFELRCTWFDGVVTVRATRKMR